MRYINHSIPGTGQADIVAILENYSRAMLASDVTLTQDTNAYLSVLHEAMELHGSPKIIVTDGGGIFHSDRAKAIYEDLGIQKEQIERRQPWQSYIETAFNVQRRMADYFFTRAESWEELLEEHDLWLERYNTHRHEAHEDRQDGWPQPIRCPRSCEGGASSPRRPRTRFLLDQIHEKARRLWVRPHKALESKCRRRTSLM